MEAWNDVPGPAQGTVNWDQDDECHIDGMVDKHGNPVQPEHWDCVRDSANSC